MVAIRRYFGSNRLAVQHISAAHASGVSPKAGRVRSGSGFFRASAANSPEFTLIFMGRGNGCDNAEDFTNWRLEVEGTKADYAFFGKTKIASTE